MTVLQISSNKAEGLASFCADLVDVRGPLKIILDHQTQVRIFRYLLEDLAAKLVELC